MTFCTQNLEFLIIIFFKGLYKVSIELDKTECFLILKHEMHSLG